MSVRKIMRTLDMVEVAGFEPVAFASRTQRSTKLSHTSRLLKDITTKDEVLREKFI